MDARGGIGDTKRRHRNNFGSPCQEYRGKLRGGRGDWERTSRSRSQREVVLQNGKSECWDGDRIHLGGQMTLCVKPRFWDRDR